MSDAILAELIAGLRAGGPDMTIDPHVLRHDYEALFETMPVAGDLSFRDQEIAGVDCIRVTPPGDAEGLVIYLHGGGYVVGSAEGYRGLAGEVARAAGMEALVVDYTLAPEYPFPNAVEDAVAVIMGLRAQGLPARKIVLAGDSAGGGLVLATLLKLRELEEDMPAAALLISPWADLTCTAASLESNRAADPSLTKEGLQSCAKHYLAGQEASDPLASPVLGDLTGLPPLLVQVGDIEILLDDAKAVAKRAEEAGVEVTLEIHPGLPHVFHAFHFMLPQAKKALDDAGAFLSGKMGGL